VRPAWTGSPDRTPSTIPPVTVPKSAANGSRPADESEGGVILTPPGSGGDVHGDPGVGGAPGGGPSLPPTLPGA
jgi:cell division protease FtsH